MSIELRFLPQILGHFYRTWQESGQLTGILSIGQGELHKRFYLDDGAIVYAESDLPDEQLEVNITPWGAYLRGNTLLDQTELDWVLVSYIKMIAHSAFPWQDCSYNFEEIALPDTSYRISVPLDLVIFEGLRAINKVALIKEMLGPLNVLLRPVAERVPQCKQLELNAEEQRVLSLITGSQQSINNIVMMGLVHDIQSIVTLRTICGLAELGVLEREEDMSNGAVRLEPATITFSNARSVMDYCHKVAAKLNAINATTDPFKVLEVTEGASLDEIKEAHNRLARLFHPDLQTKFKRYNLYLRSELEYLYARINQAFDYCIKSAPVNGKKGSQGVSQSNNSYTNPDEAYIGKTIDNRFLIESLLGSGGMGTVFRARDLVMERPVAIKLLPHELIEDEELLQRFHREARATARIEHPNIVTVYDFRTLPDLGTIIIMECIQGRTLSYLLSRRIALPAPDALVLMKQIVMGVAAAHKQGVIHRDLKPDNIMLKDIGRGEVSVKLVDFGIARMMESIQSTTSISGANTVIGTPFYMSPEQCITSKIDERSDIYALGIIFYEMLIGEPPFQGATAEIMRKHMTDDVPSMRKIDHHIPVELENLIFAMLKKRKEERPPLSEVLQRLDELEGIIGVQADNYLLDRRAVRPLPQELQITPY